VCKLGLGQLTRKASQEPSASSAMPDVGRGEGGQKRGCVAAIGGEHKVVPRGRGRSRWRGFHHRRARCLRGRRAAGGERDREHREDALSLSCESWFAHGRRRSASVIRRKKLTGNAVGIRVSRETRNIFGLISRAPFHVKHGAQPTRFVSRET
jgi:hypothetical protein